MLIGPHKSEEEKYKDAEKYIDTILLYLPDYSDFQIDDIIQDVFRNDEVIRNQLFDCHHEISELLKLNRIAKIGTFNLQLKLTDSGREKKKELIYQSELNEEPKEYVENPTFDEEANAVFRVLLYQKLPYLYSMINYELRKKYPQLRLHEIIEEFRRLDLIAISYDSKGEKTYLLTQQAKKKLAQIPTEFADNPYEYFCVSRDHEDSDKKEKENLELQKLRDEVLDYQEKLNRERRHYKIALAVAIIEGISLILSQLLK